MKYDILLADADGTLFDFLAGERCALLKVLTAFGLPVDEETIALYSRINDGHWKKLERGETTQARIRVERFEDFLAALGQAGNEAATAAAGDPQAMSAAYVEALGEQRILLPGAVALCQAVSQHMPIYLVTNGISRVQRSRFAGCGIAPYIAGVVISEEVGHAKPEPDMLHEAMKLAAVTDPRRAVMLGDSLTADIGAAINAGVDSIWFLNGAATPLQHGATWAVKTLEEAQALILA